MPLKRKPRTVLEYAVATTGIRNAVRAINWAYCWAVVREVHDREPTVEEVAEWWNMARRTAFRDQAAFRTAFPMLDSPGPLYASEEAREGLRKHAALGQKIDDWGAERRARRELHVAELGVLRLPPSITG